MAELARKRLLIADDHLLFAEAIRQLLAKSYDVVGIVTDGHALIREAEKLVPDVIVVDVGMPLLNGFDAAQRIRQTLPKVKLIFLTMQEDPLLAAAVHALGHSAFILKQSAAHELLEAIDQVMLGKSFITAKLRADDWVEEKARVRQFSKALTSRQREIVQMFAEGRQTKEIAAFLSLSEKTIEFHKYHIMETYGLRNGADVVMFALKLGLISFVPEARRR
jgi:DNA-binding NarL/FixJ family response regulator